MYKNIHQNRAFYIRIFKQRVHFSIEKEAHHAKCEASLKAFIALEEINEIKE